MRPLTERQQQVLSVIKSSLDACGMPPTRAEIARQLGFKSANAAEEHLKALAKKGVLEMVPGMSRGIRLHPDFIDESAISEAAEDGIKEQVDGLPLIGKVAAGQPILAIEHVETYYPANAQIFSPKADFLLRVDGSSMRDIGILDGDLLAVHKTQQVRDGQVVVARIEDEVTVKRLERKAGKVFLHAENPNFSTLVVDPEHQHLSIEGLAVGVLRTGDWH